MGLQHGCIAAAMNSWLLSDRKKRKRRRKNQLNSMRARIHRQVHKKI